MSKPVSMSLRDILAIIELVRNIDVNEIMRVPILEDSEDTRKWARAVVNAGILLAKYTGTEFDDKTLKQVSLVIEDDKNWTTIHSLVLFVYDLFIEKKNLEAAIDEAVKCKKIDEAAQVVGLAPLAIMAIVQAALTILRILQEWRKRRGIVDVRRIA